ncbi:DNA-binding protein RFX5-like [Corticium candelabrum]|uniref:DNA-binding protein RFX5-like n=1 Tax=Corticium candelabrum TaxID=121492 RepID=UPI002E264361|nr:DNA-binding protein RFX5-like [Corticium candelabrum]
MDLSLPHASCFLSRNEDRQLHPLEERLKQTASSDAEKEISRILDDVDRLSDKDKLLLYLKMPVGEKAQRNCCSLDSVSTTKMNNVQRSKVEAQQWLRANYEELQNCSVGRQEVYDHYRKSCELANARALNQQDFGKVVKHVFRSVTYRRLGNRSNSKYLFTLQ